MRRKRETTIFSNRGGVIKTAVLFMLVCFTSKKSKSTEIELQWTRINPATFNTPVITAKLQLIPPLLLRVYYNKYVIIKPPMTLLTYC